MFHFHRGFTPEMESFEKEIVPFIIDLFARLSSLLASSLPPFFYLISTIIALGYITTTIAH